MVEESSGLTPDLDGFCEQFGYTTEKLARELGVSRATIFNWKKDSRGIPRIVQLALAALTMSPELQSMPRQSKPTPRKQYRRNSYVPEQLGK